MFEGEDFARVCSFHMVIGRGVTCLKFNVRNCGDVVNALMKIKSKREHLQIALTQVRRRKTRRLIRV